MLGFKRYVHTFPQFGGEYEHTLPPFGGEYEHTLPQFGGRYEHTFPVDEMSLKMGCYVEVVWIFLCFCISKIEGRYEQTF